ncbi:hypothetical protein EC968_005333 [Mortierella alpina]|nr:hypothetical protein EC968_005333 [Mortierella alpina]
MYHDTSSHSQYTQNNKMTSIAKNGREQEEQRPVHTRQNTLQHDRVFVLSSPATLTRPRKSSVDSMCSIASTSSTASSEGNSVYATPRSRRSVISIFDADDMEPLAFDSPTQSDLDLSVIRLSALSDSPLSTSYQLLLQQIAAQREKLELLRSGADSLAEDASVLDDALEDETSSVCTAIQGAKAAVNGWEETWTEYSKCEPVEALQTQPLALSTLILGMKWQYKKNLFEQLVTSCRPREAYQLQHQISLRYGDVFGFDLLEEFPVDIWGTIMKLLSFADLASCRMVSHSWQDKAMAYDVVASALARLTYTEDAVGIESADQPKKNWNQLCRYQERDSRWRKSQPASIYAMTGHTSYVTSLKDCDKWIVSGGYDEKVRLWDATTGKCVRIWEVDSAVSCVELLVDESLSGGGIVVAAFVDIGLVKIWSLHGALNMHTLTGHQKGVRALAINERYLATAGFDQTVLVWNWSSGRKVASFRAHNEVILGVHLVKNTVYSVCIDATLRVFDIPSRSLLHQVKLFEVTQGSSLQWSCLRGTMLLTATNKTIYVWQLEHLESLVRQQVHYRSASVLSQGCSSYSSSVSSGSSMCEDSFRGSEQLFTPPMSPKMAPSRSTTTSSLTTLISPPGTPAMSTRTLAPSPGSAFCSASIYSTLSESGSSLYLGADSSFASGSCRFTTETRIKPCLTAVLSMTMDMWCGRVTHHDPPLLILGSRSSPVKLSTVSLTTDIIDPCKAYDSNYEPLRISPKAVPIEGFPTGHGRGVMCLDSSAGRLVVGSTGGAIHVLNMDPAKKTLVLPKSSAPVTIITLPHLTPTQIDSIRSASPVHPPLLSASEKATSTTNPRKPIMTSKSLSSGTKSRSRFFGLSTPDSSPLAVPITLTSPSGGTRGVSPSRRHGTKQSPATPPSDYEEQEVLVDYDEYDLGRRQARGASASSKASKTQSMRQAEITPTATTTATASTGKPSSRKPKPTATTTSPTKTNDKRVSDKKATPLSPTTPTHPSRKKPLSSSSAAQTLSSLSRLIMPGSPSKLMMRRRAASAAWAEQVTSTMTTTISSTTGAEADAAPSRPVSIITRGRIRSEGDLLGASRAASTKGPSKSLSKSWSLSAPWSNPSKRTDKTK